MKNAKRILLTCVSAPFLGLSLSACSGGLTGATSTEESLNVSGVLSLGNSSQSLEKIQSAVKEESVSAMSVDLSQYKVSCATTTAPVRSASADVGADGSFSVSIPGATGQPLSCYLVNAVGDKAADFLISDDDKKDLNGNKETSSTAAFKKNANLGTINFDPNAGEVTVPKANIAAVVAAPVATSSIFDPTGAWDIGAVDFTLPKGVKAPCENDNECHGPRKGQEIYLKMWKGRVVSDSSDIYGLQVWEGQGAFGTCESKIGLTDAVKTELGVDFSANGSADTPFNFAPSVTGFHDQITDATSDVTMTDGWKMSTAKLLRDLNPDCAPQDVTIGGVTYSNAWKCGPDSGNLYQIHLGGGCTDSNGKPVEVNDWGSLTCDPMETDVNGVKSMSCHGGATVNNQSVSVNCSNKWVVTDAGNAVSNGDFHWDQLAKLSKDTTCASIADGNSSESRKIAQLQCYGDYYYRSGMERAGACLPRVEMDWSANSSTNFAMVDKLRPQGLIFFEKYTPFPDGSGGSLMTRQEHYEGVNVNGSNWVNCRVIEVGGLTIKKVSDTRLLATYQSSVITTSLTKPACLAKFNGTRESYVFYLNK